MHTLHKKTPWILSLSFIILVSGCQLLSTIFTKKLPPLNEIAGNYYGILQGNQTGFNSLVLNIDTLGNFTASYMSSDQKIHQFHNKLKVNKDSTFNLTDSLGRTIVFKYKDGDASLLVKEKLHNAFENSKAPLEKTTLDFSDANARKNQLFAIQGYYAVLSDKTEQAKNNNTQWEILLRSDNSFQFLYAPLAIQSTVPFKSQDIILLADGGYKFDFEVNNIQFNVKSTKDFQAQLEVKDLQTNLLKSHKGTAEIYIQSAFLDGSWKLISLKGHPINYMRFSFSTPSLLFQKFGKSMIGNDGCNELFGNFNFDQHHISLKGALGQTKKFCQDTDDVTFKEMLTSSNTYKIGGDTLNLIGPEGRLTFRKEQTPKKAPLIHNDDEEE